MNHSRFIQELFQEGDAWHISIRELGDAGMLSMEMFPNMPPYGVTIAEEFIITEPELIGSFLIRGLTSDTLPHMAEDYAQKFRDAGLKPYETEMLATRPDALAGAPEAGKVRTWFAGIDQPYDMPEEEAAALHADGWVDVGLPGDLTVWEPIIDKTITFKYPNGMEYQVALSSIEESDVRARRLLNHLNYLIIPADESLNPVLNAITVPNMFQLRLVLEKKDREAKEKQLEIGFMILEFSNAIKGLAKGGSWQNPVDRFRSGLGKS